MNAPSGAGRNREIWAWALFDFANSPFTTLVVTFIYATYFTQSVAAGVERGTVLWSRGVTITGLLVAVLSPVLGALADRGGFRKVFLGATTVVCVAGTAALYWIDPSRVVLALACFVIANVAFETAEVFYNAFLPDIAPPDRIGRVSGIGWGLGYAGGLLALVVALVALVQPETPWLGFSKEGGESIRATNLLVAIWFAVFSIPTFVVLREDKSRITRQGSVTREAYRQLRDTFVEIRRYRQIVRLLLARLFYNDGLITVFAFGGIYAAGTFGFTFEEILVFGIVLNVAAGIGAFALGWVDDRLGGKRTIAISLWGLMASALLAVLAPTKALFWVAGIGVGIFAGPNQSASRSLLGRFVPPDKENEFYGFFAFSGKATAFLGPFALGVLTQISGSQRVGVAVVVVLLLAGYLLLRGVDEAVGIRAAGRDSRPRSPSM
jgi:UMF1 family MFS transporter